MKMKDINSITWSIIIIIIIIIIITIYHIKVMVIVVRFDFMSNIGGYLMPNLVYS